MAEHPQHAAEAPRAERNDLRLRVIVATVSGTPTGCPRRCGHPPSGLPASRVSRLRTRSRRRRISPVAVANCWRSWSASCRCARLTAWQLIGEHPDHGAVTAFAAGWPRWGDDPSARGTAGVLDAGADGVVAVEEVQGQSAFAVHAAEGDRLLVAQHPPDGLLGVLLGTLRAPFGGGGEPLDALLAVGRGAGHACGFFVSSIDTGVGATRAPTPPPWRLRWSSGSPPSRAMMRSRAAISWRRSRSQTLDSAIGWPVRCSCWRCRWAISVLVRSSVS